MSYLGKSRYPSLPEFFFNFLKHSEINALCSEISSRHISTDRPSFVTSNNTVYEIHLYSYIQFCAVQPKSQTDSL